MPYPEPRDVRPHVVLAGAGASRAACPDGDRHGRRLPLMLDFAESLDLQSFFGDHAIECELGTNFEDTYSALYERHEMAEARSALDHYVRGYFEAIELPDEPTAYDYLVLSLRAKDVVATFNWDPLLVQAYRRNAHFASLPGLLFLHGNVEVGYCPNHDAACFGTIGSQCGRCGSRRMPTPLLFPIRKKDYNSDRGIADAWRLLHDALGHAYVFTIFGYSAPFSDVEAVDLLKDGWGTASQRSMEQIEIIDLKSRDELGESWRDFIHTHHYETTDSLHRSIIGQSPRRSIEQMLAQFVDAEFIDYFPAPGHATWDDVYAFFEPLVAAERALDSGA